MRVAARSADANHPYGHDKADFYCAVIEDALITVTAPLIFDEAWKSWAQVRTLSAPFRGTGLNAAATVINGVWSAALIGAGRRLRSPALAAGGRLTFLEFHLVMPGSMTVAIAHRICGRIENALKAEMGHLMITIPMEPEAKAKQGGVPVL
jgi:divalent metal cation (Fe/Co/Zn/Cd) transporter